MHGTPSCCATYLILISGCVWVRVRVQHDLDPVVMILFISEQGIQSTHAFVLWYGYLLANTVQTIIIVTKQSYQAASGTLTSAPEPGLETDSDLHGARENQNQSVFFLIWTLSWYEMLEMTHSL